MNTQNAPAGFVCVENIKIPANGKRGLIGFVADSPGTAAWGANTETRSEERDATVYGITECMTLGTALGLHSCDLSSLCITQHQIASIIEELPHIVRKDNYTIALFRHGGKFFIAFVTRAEDVPQVTIHRFEEHMGWLTEHEPYLIIPK